MRYSNKQFRKLVETVNESKEAKSRKIYVDREPRKIDWVAYTLQQIFNRTKDSDGILSGDGTGLEISRKQNYGSNRQSTKEFLTSIVDSREIIQAFDFSGEDECNVMFELIEEVEGYSLRLDAGFNCRESVKKIAELGMLPYVYPIKSNKINGAEDWREMHMEFFTEVILWLREYYLRAHTEAFILHLKECLVL